MLVHMMMYSDIFSRCQCCFMYGNASENISHELLIVNYNGCINTAIFIVLAETKT